MDETEEINDLFDKLNILTHKKKKVNCCENEENYMLSDKITVCRICNSTVSNLTTGAEWRFYGNDDNKSSDPARCGMPVNLLLPNSSIGSTVSTTYTTNKDIHKVKRFQQWNGMTYRERSRYKVFNDIKSVCEKHNIPLIIIKEANSLYTISSETKISRGNNRIGLIAACVYFACKNCKVPRSSKEIATIFEIKSVLVTKGIKTLQEILQLKDNNKRIDKVNTINQSDFIERFCYKLNISKKDVEEINKISMKTIENNIISENTPPSIAAGCIYLYIIKNKLNISKKKISEVCNISEVTINKCYLKINNHKDIIC